MSGAEIWGHINDTLAAVKWPAVVALAGWFLRRELAGLVGRLLRIEAAGTKVEFDPKQETLLLGEEISESGERVVHTAIKATRVTSYAGGLVDGATSAVGEGQSVGTQIAGGAAEPGAMSGNGSESERLQNLETLRGDLVSLIEASFQAGFVAGVGSEPGGGIPRPTVHWNGSEPRVTGWTFETGNVALRELVGERLRNLRVNAGISRGDAGWAIRSSESKISRIEKGAIAVREQDIEALLTLYGMDEGPDRAELVRLAQAARGSH